ncbi:Methyl-accepting chemotaxis protein [Candidatus Terasakiella magnetica]|nr:Methyl-accepting chemotaxis protein [Candidatus Terasakiella magnetica]
MRLNEPITDQELELPEGTVLVSRTDLGGRITFVNQAFVDISGYSEEELIGAPHNLVRHPHMPAVAFADLWATIKAGKPWEGIVKNRSKSGDHYWVRANATPEVENGQITGYISIRTAPTRKQIEAAEHLYAAVRTGQAKNVKVSEGRVISTTLAARLGRTFNSITGRLIAILVLLLLLAGFSVVTALDGMGDSNDALRAVYEDRTVPAGQLADIVDRMRYNVQLSQQMLIDLGEDPGKISGLAGRIRANASHITAVWQAYRAAKLTDEEKVLADTFQAERGTFVREGLEVAIALAEKGDAVELRRHLSSRMLPLFSTAHDAQSELLALQIRASSEQYAAAKDDFIHHMRLGLSVLAVSILLASVLTVLLVRYLRRPLADQERYFDIIARGDLSCDIPGEEVHEFQRSNVLLRAMKAKLAYSAMEVVENNRRAQEQLKKEMLTLTELLEGEVDTTVAEISTQAERLKEGAAKLLETAEGLRIRAEEVSSSIQVTSGNVQTVAGATEELEASSREISSRVGRSSELSDAARHKVAAASASVGTLTEATARIGDVAALIQTIAGQTRMLALNATIEAARAGEAGRGFAVVASEVKGLADQTEQAIGRVNAQAREIEQTTQVAVATVEAVAETIKDMDIIAGQVAVSADEQRAATAEIMSSAVQAADHTRDVADAAREVLLGAAQTGSTARKVSELSALVNHDIGALQRRLNVILRTSYSGNRRTVERIPAAMPFVATFSGQTFTGHTGDVSVRGALLVVGGTPKLEGETGTIEFPGICTIPAKAVLGSALGIQCQFLKYGSDSKKLLEAGIEAAKARDLPHIAVAQKVAASVQEAFERAVREGVIDLKDVFDNEYVPVEDTDPMQVIAKHTDVTDRLLPAIIEPALSGNPDAVFCCATDRNGYIATHNRIYSEPQRKDDPVWNAAHSRNRRMFDDRTGILAARTTKAYLAQTYARDMGGGQHVLLKEFDSPIVVGGRHWGAIRYGVRL